MKVYSKKGLKSGISGKVGGAKVPIRKGTNSDRYGQGIVQAINDDMLIQFKSTQVGFPNVNGEAHRMVLMGYTTGNTRGYAYAEGNTKANRIKLFSGTTMLVRVSGTATVVGGTSATYTLGHTEGFSYNTAFTYHGGNITQIDSPGGKTLFTLKNGGVTNCTLYISTSNNEITFGLDDAQTDTNRVWVLTADIEVQRIQGITYEFGANYALYQNADNIHLQNNNNLIWN